MKKPLAPGLYYFANHSHINAPQMTGSSLTLTWKQIEPSKGQFDWGRIDNWVSIEKANSHKWVWRMDVHQNRGVVSWPGWAPAHALRMADGNQLLVPAYEAETWQQNMVDAIMAVGARYDSDPDLTMVQIALGLYGETHPERNDTEGNLSSQLYDSGLLTPCQWIDYCKRIIDAYVAAFPMTELVIMNAPAWPYPCRDTESPYSQSWPRKEVQNHAIAKGVGAQNNSLDEWDASWYTAIVDGSNGPYEVTGSVGPFMDADLMYAGERGSWLRPFPVQWQPQDYQTWWSYLNALDKGMRIIFPPQWPGRVWDDTHYVDYPSGVFNYVGPCDDLLAWMNQFALDVLAGKTKFWAAFDAPHNPPAYWHDTAQHHDHYQGVKRLTNMASEWDAAGAKPPFYESKYMRRLDGPVEFEIEPGRYEVTVAHRGALEILDRQYTPSDDWVWHRFTADVPSVFAVAGTGHLHCMIFERVGDPPPPPPPPDKQTYGPFNLFGKRITIIIEGQRR